jgi:hypothetical protein
LEAKNMNPKHPGKTPINQWSLGWLKMETASILGVPGYILMHDHEKSAADYPVTAEEMRAFIKERRKAGAPLTNPDLIDEPTEDERRDTEYQAMHGSRP